MKALKYSLVAVFLTMCAFQHAECITQPTVYKTFGREVLTKDDLNNSFVQITNWLLNNLMAGGSTFTIADGDSIIIYKAVIDTIRMTGPIYGASGSASAPGYSFDGNPGMGMWRAGPDTLTFSVEGGAVVTIDSLGQVGINDTSPDYLLDVEGTANITGVTTHGGNVVSDTDGTDDLGTTSVRWANVYADGVGDAGQAITVTGADINLTASADVNIPANVGLKFGNDGEGIEGDGTNLTIASSGVLNVNATGALTATAAGGSSVTVATGGGLDINMGTAAGDDFTLDTTGFVYEGDTGNVGIGTASPTNTLEVSAAAGAPTVRLSAWSATDATKARIIIAKSGSDTEDTPVETADGEFLGQILVQGVNSGPTAASCAAINFLQDGASGASFVPGEIRFQTATNAAAVADRMTIDSAGNVGIGVTPSGWQSAFTGVHIGGTGVFMTQSAASAGNTFSVGSNWNYDTDNSYEYIVNDEATKISQGNGAFAFDYAPSGVAAGGDIASWTNRMTIDSSGNVTPGGNKTQDMGVAGTAWDDVAGDDFVNEADWPMFDDRDDLAALLAIKPDSTRIDTLHGYQIIDDNTLPEWIKRRWKKDGKHVYREAKNARHTVITGRVDTVIVQPKMKPDSFGSVPSVYIFPDTTLKVVRDTVEVVDGALPTDTVIDTLSTVPAVAESSMVYKEGEIIADPYTGNPYLSLKMMNAWALGSIKELTLEFRAYKDSTDARIAKLEAAVAKLQK